MPHFNEVPIRPRSGGGPSATLLFFLLMEEAVTQSRRTERKQQRLMVAQDNINIPISAPRGKRGNQSVTVRVTLFMDPRNISSRGPNISRTRM